MSYLRKCLYLLIILSMGLTVLNSCSGEIYSGPTARSKIQQLEKLNADIPTLGNSTAGGTVFESMSGKHAVWGVENDQWQTVGKNLANFHKYMEGSIYVNANAIAIHSPWIVIEPEKDVYDFSDLDYYLALASENNLKVIIYFTSSNYAGGDNTFTPRYIVEDPDTYTRIEMDELSSVPVEELPLCPANPNLFERESKAAEKLFEHIKKVNTDGNILAVCMSHEFGFMHRLRMRSNTNLDIRCQCEFCEELYTPDLGNLEFMTKLFSEYISDVIKSATDIYPITTYSPVASLVYWPGGRFVEQPDIIKAAVNRKNHFVCPSVATTMNADLFRIEMDQFVSIEGNPAFASGIDTGWANHPYNNQARLEIAPWISMFEYDGLGAIYWDHPQMTVTDTRGVREKLRTGWGPLKGGEYFVSRIKSDKDVMFHWLYESEEKTEKIGNYEITISQRSKFNNGYAVLVDVNEIMVTATTFNEERTKVEIKSDHSFKGYSFERGYYDTNGEFVRVSEFEPKQSGKSITFNIDGDSGDYTKSIYRIVKN